MAKKFSMGALIAVGAAAAAIGGGVAAYLNREALKQVANDISEKLASRKDEEDDFFVEFEEEPVVHATDKVADESDFVDAEGEADEPGVKIEVEIDTSEEVPAAEEAVEA
jgi:hypothetical protein